MRGPAASTKGRFAGDEAELDVLPRALTAQPRVEHERDLVERQRVSVVPRHGEDHSLAYALARAPAHAHESLSQQEHAFRFQDAHRVLLQARNRAGPGGSAGGDHQMLVREPAPVDEVHTPGFRVDALDSPALARDRRAREGRVDGQARCLGIRAERYVDEVGSKHEPVVVADHVHVDPIGELPREQKRRL
jgi:hypothetical protein